MQEFTNLLRFKLPEADELMSSELFRGIEQGLLDVLVTDKMFGATGDDDGCLSNRGVEQILEIVQRFLIGDTQNKFIFRFPPESA